jgi:hypothetical protein
MAGGPLHSLECLEREGSFELSSNLSLTQHLLNYGMTSHGSCIGAPVTKGKLSFQKILKNGKNLTRLKIAIQRNFSAEGIVVATWYLPNSKGTSPSLVLHMWPTAHCLLVTGYWGVSSEVGRRRLI